MSLVDGWRVVREHKGAGVTIERHVRDKREMWQISIGQTRDAPELCNRPCVCTWTMHRIRTCFLFRSGLVMWSQCVDIRTCFLSPVVLDLPGHKKQVLIYTRVFPKIETTVSKNRFAGRFAGLCRTRRRSQCVDRDLF